MLNDCLPFFNLIPEHTIFDLNMLRVAKSLVISGLKYNYFVTNFNKIGDKINNVQP